MKCVTLWGGKTVHILKDPTIIEGLCVTMCGHPKMYSGDAHLRISSGVVSFVSSSRELTRLVPTEPGIRPTCNSCINWYWKKSRTGQA